MLRSVSKVLPTLIRPSLSRGFVNSLDNSSVMGGLRIGHLSEADDSPVEAIDHRQHHKPLGKHLLVTCEHATDRLPRPYTWMEEDKWLKGTHWSCDPGAADFAREFSFELGSFAVLSRFSRLLVDPNRPLASSTLFRSHCDGKPVALNQGLTQADQDWRLWRYYLPYHLALGRAANLVEPSLVLSVHSFTHNYEGEVRDFELGVLCSTQDKLAKRIATALQQDGVNARINEPWSGKEGFMFAADSLAIAGGPGKRRAVMLELRNDLAMNREWRHSIIRSLVKVFDQVIPESLVQTPPQ
eukprot:GILI01028130.1.p1 GENE.GILI01028130.1~~GILI01028130.1.p1  ORF type:complete len:298 (-),score=34.75 GILI01028130.1:33-926(-)